MKLNDILISTKLRAGFALIMLMVLVLGIISYYQGQALWTQTKEMYEHPLTVRRALGSVKADILIIHRNMKDMVMLNNRSDFSHILSSSKVADDDVTRQISILYSAYLGPKADIDSLRHHYLVWGVIRDQTTAILNDGNISEAYARTSLNGVGGKQVDVLLADVEKISEFAYNKSNEFYSNALKKKQELIRQTLIVLLLTLFLGLVISYYLTRVIQKPLKELVTASDKFRSGNYDTRIAYQSKNEIGQLAASLNALANTLQAELIIYEDAASVSSIMLREEEIHQFCFSVLNTLMQLTNSQMGAVYLLEDERTAYDPFETIGLRKDLLRSFDLNDLDGEIGLTLARGEVHHLVRIPADTVYNFSTTSGEMKPREIITIPVKNTKGVLAVISLSSIYEYPPTALRLIKDILPTMTARMNGVLLFDEITGLANKLEQQNAELQAQKNELAAQAAEVAEQNIELEMQKKELDESNRLKSVFLSNMSHELRTPLNSVIALSGVLSRRLENQIPETEYSYLEVIGRNGSHLLSLINDILDISRIESGKVEFDYSQFHPSSLIDDLVNMIRPQAIEKGINLKVDIPADNPLLISDYTKCRHILQNLIGNAVKFTNKGDVSIRMEKQDDMLGFVVSDTGIGIHQDKIKHIFDEFRQADESTSRKYGGTGLGLAIAQKYAVLLYGRIEVRSVPEQGSTFTFWLPVENHQLQISSVQAHPSTDQKIPQPDKQETVMEGIGRTILVVEDSEPAIIQLQDILHEQGYQTRVAKNGREALEQIALTIPDGIILDLMMPEVDGFEVLKTLRSNESTARVPVLILTAKHVTKAEISFLASNHIYQLIQKGDVKKSALLKQISSMLDHRLQDDQVIESHSAKPDADRIDRKLKHSNTPLVLIVEDNADNLLTIKALLSDEYKTLEAMDGKSGVELARRYKPDLILMDIALPVMNGLQALTAIREYEDLRHIPIIAVTASVMKGNREEILQYGFDGFVAKPINHTIFFEVIEGVLYGAK